MQRHGLTALLLLVLLGPSAISAAVLDCGGGPRGERWSAQRCTGPVWLVRHGADARAATAGSPSFLQSEVSQHSAPTSGASSMTGWQRAGVYGVEFGGAATGTAIAAAGAVGIYGVLAGPDPYNDLLMPLSYGLLLTTSLLSSPCLAATGTYFGGRIVRQHGSFWRTLVGSLAGGVLGTAGAYWYGSSWSSSHGRWGPTQNAICLSSMVVPTLLGAVVTYNVWE